MNENTRQAVFPATAAPAQIHRVCARAAAGVLLAVILSAGVFIVSQADHAHTGYGCPVCHRLAACELLLESVGFAAAGLAALRVAGRRPPRVLVVCPAAAPISRRVALFSDFVRLNN